MALLRSAFAAPLVGIAGFLTGATGLRARLRYGSINEDMYKIRVMEEFDIWRRYNVAYDQMVEEVKRWELEKKNKNKPEELN